LPRMPRINGYVALWKASAACTIPAFNVMRVDPIVALEKD